MVKIIFLSQRYSSRSRFRSIWPSRCDRQYLSGLVVRSEDFGLYIRYNSKVWNLQVSQMSVSELRELISDVVEEKFAKYADPDYRS